MTPEQLDRLCADALQRITYYVNRMCAQQLRRMREGWQHQASGPAGSGAGATATRTATPTHATPQP